MEYKRIPINIPIVTAEPQADGGSCPYAEPFELMVGRLAATRRSLPEEDLAVGRTIRLEHRDWTISGRFAAPDTILEAELWARLEDLMLGTEREDVSCVALRLESPDRLPDVSYFAAKRLTSSPPRRSSGPVTRPGLFT